MGQFNKRLKWIDATKGLCILLIMISHCMPINNYVNVFLFSGYVAIYFILSGFTYRRKGTLRGEFISKFKRLLIPFFIYSVFAVLTYAPFCSLVQIIEGLGGQLYNRYSLYKFGSSEDIHRLSPESTPMWFITCFFLSYALFFIYDSVKSIRNKVLAIILYIVLAAILSRLPILLPWSIEVAFLGAVLIAVGQKAMQLGYTRMKDKTQLLKMIVIALIFYMPLAYYNGIVNMSVDTYGRYGILSTIPFILIACLATIIYCNVLRILNDDNKVITLFSILGGQSLTLMMVHIPLFCLFNRILHNYSIVINDYLRGSLSILIVLILVSLFYKVKGHYNIKLLKYL